MNSPHYYGNHIAHVSFYELCGFSVLINNPRDTQDTWSIPQAIRGISEFINGLYGLNRKLPEIRGASRKAAVKSVKSR